MRLDRLTLVLRRRTPWEALDLGGVMLRQWTGPIYRAWFATYVPFSVLLLLLCWQMPNLGVFLVWWLKPAFDRVLLVSHVPALRDAFDTVIAVAKVDGLSQVEVA